MLWAIKLDSQLRPERHLVAHQSLRLHQTGSAVLMVLSYMQPMTTSVDSEVSMPNCMCPLVLAVMHARSSQYICYSMLCCDDSLVVQVHNGRGRRYRTPQPTMAATAQENSASQQPGLPTSSSASMFPPLKRPAGVSDPTAHFDTGFLTLDPMVQKMLDYNGLVSKATRASKPTVPVPTPQSNPSITPIHDVEFPHGVHA